MKKILIIAMTMLMVLSICVVSNASTNSTLPSELYSIGSKYGMLSQDTNRITRYLSLYPLTDAQCDQILALANQADAIMVANGTTNVKSLPTSAKNELKALANQAANIAGVTLTFKNSKIYVYKDGVLFDVIGQTTTHANTGNGLNIALATATILSVALAGIVSKRKIVCNA